MVLRSLAQLISLLPENTKPSPRGRTEPDEDIRQTLCASDPVETIFPLSDAVTKLVQSVSQTAANLPVGLSQRLSQVLENSEILWKSPFPRQKGVFKCSADIVVKAVRNLERYTQYTTLQYLELHRPNILAPKPHGLVCMSGVSLIFMSHIPSIPLGKVWHMLDHYQKSFLSNQLSMIITDLRTLPFTEGSPFGGTAGEGCTDIRRHVRTSKRPITTFEDFETFLYSSPHAGGDVFVKFLRQLSPSSSELPVSRIIFTHGDISPDNVMVELIDNNYKISGIIDWEYSGFYPDYYESVRCTNCITPYENDDWFLYLPECVSPSIYAQWWLLDRVRESRVV